MIQLPTQHYRCLNGPCQGSLVEAPTDATPGTATALPWRTIRGADRFAVYMLVDWNGSQGLMFMKSYSSPVHAQWKVEKLSMICAGAVA